MAKDNALWGAERIRGEFLKLGIRVSTREVVYFNVTRCPTDAWVAQQLREATPYWSGPRYLIRDNDDKFCKRFAAANTGP